jgi:hypothetical protein
MALRNRPNIPEAIRKLTDDPGVRPPTGISERMGSQIQMQKRGVSDSSA